MAALPAAQVGAPVLEQPAHGLRVFDPNQSEHYLLHDLQGNDIGYYTVGDQANQLDIFNMHNQKIAELTMKPHFTHVQILGQKSYTIHLNLTRETAGSPYTYNMSDLRDNHVLYTVAATIAQNYDAAKKDMHALLNEAVGACMQRMKPALSPLGGGGIPAECYLG